MADDELKVPSQRTDQGGEHGVDDAYRHGVDDVRRERAGDDPARESSADDDLRVVVGTNDEPHDEPRDVLPGESPGTADQGDPHARDYKDPYTPATGDLPMPGTGAQSSQVPSHAAPQETVLFDRDPAEVQARWRDLQSAFVDDPGEAVKQADGLVGEIVESLTSALSARTEELRERWEGAGEGDTERLRLALREYRSVLERLLDLTTAGAGTHSSGPRTR